MVNQKVVVLEENELNLVFLKKLLKRWQIEIEVLENSHDTLMKINHLKPDVLLISLDLSMDYENLLIFLERKNNRIILYGKRECPSQWKNSPMILGIFPPPLEMNLFSLQSAFFPQLKDVFNEDEARPHIDAIIVNSVCIMEISGRIKWEDMHHLKYSILNLLMDGEVTGLIFIFEGVENSEHEMHEAMEPFSLFQTDLPIPANGIRYVLKDEPLAAFFKLHPFFSDLHRMKSYAEAFLQIKGERNLSSKIGVELKMIKEGQQFSDALYDIVGNKVKESKAPFLAQDIENLKKDGVDWLFYKNQIQILDEEGIIWQKRAQKKYILLIDDDNNIQKILSFFLRKIGFNVKIYSKAETALNFALSNTPCFILLDLQLPGMNGIEFLKKYKQEVQNRNLPEAPVIVLSCISKKNVVQDLLKMGIKNYILKPFDLKTVDAKIKLLIPD